MRIQVVGKGLDKKSVWAIEENIIQLLPAKLASRHSGENIQIAESTTPTEPGLDVLGEQIERSGV